MSAGKETEGKALKLLLNLGLLTHHAAKPIYWQWFVVKENIAFIAGAKQGVQAASVQRAWTPWWVSAKHFLRPGGVAGVWDPFVNSPLIGW